ncbi:MAG: terminase [Desulfobacteraceae bacterium]|nr:terminase [Desulfobacteraceae bacterium]
MGLMTRFQNKKKKDPNYGNTGGVKVIGTMPTSAIGKQQAVADLEKELKKDLASLKMIQSIKQKENEKATHLVPKYMPVVASLKASGSSHFLLGQILVWLFDIKDIHEAMELAVYCIEKKVAMPERFKRKLPTYLCDTILDWAENEHEAGRTPEPYFRQIYDLAKDWDIPDQVRARLFRLRGLIALEKEDFEQAVTELEKATEYGAKVKTALSKAQKKLADKAEQLTDKPEQN